MSDKKPIGLYLGCSALVIAICVGTWFGTKWIVTSFKSNAMTVLLQERHRAIDIGEQAKSKYNQQQNGSDSKNPTQSNQTSSDVPLEDGIKDRNQYVVVTTDGDTVYLIQNGDTLTHISSMVCYSVDELAEYNHIRNVDLIYAGSVLRIPDEDVTE